MLLNITRADSIMEECRLDAIVATTPENVTYLTGISLTAMEGRGNIYACIPAGDPEGIFAVIPANRLPTVIEQNPTVSDLRLYGGFHVDLTSVAEGLIDERLGEALSDTYESALAGLIAGMQDRGLLGARIGIDEYGLTPQQWSSMDQALPAARLEPGYNLFRQIRAVKTADEIERLGRAAEIASEAMTEALELVEPGISEGDLLCEYLAQVGRRGATAGTATIVAGPSGALLMGPPPGLLAARSSRPIQTGDLIKLDVSCAWRDYWSDTARTLVVQRPQPGIEERFQAVYAGHMEAMSLCRAGMRASELFHATVETVRERGIPDFQRTHCGHGIGLHCHELPLIAPTAGGADTVLEPGMVICLENGYYEVGLGCLTVEDTVVVTETSSYSLTHNNRHLQRLGSW
jgi:Xaa-Pro dipeptidase